MKKNHILIYTYNILMTMQIQLSAFSESQMTDIQNYEIMEYIEQEDSELYQLLKGFSWLMYFEKIAKTQGYNCALSDSCQNAGSLKEFLTFFHTTHDEKLKQKYCTLWRDFFNHNTLAKNYISQHKDGKAMLAYLQVV